jgi:hypothetical protein
MTEATTPITLISCDIIRPELEALRREHAPGARLIFLDQDLHRRPEKMPALIQAAVDEAAEDAEIERIVLGYGLCSNGLVGVTAPRQGLLVPRVHDCISLILGSREAYESQFHACPGTYYLTASWIDADKDPMGTMEREYAPKLGRETAEWGMREELRHQTRIALVDCGICPGSCDRVRDRARQNAEFFDKQYKELRGSAEFLRKLITGPYSEHEFIHVAPHEQVRQQMFFET